MNWGSTGINLLRAGNLTEARNPLAVTEYTPSIHAMLSYPFRATELTVRHGRPISQ